VSLGSGFDVKEQVRQATDIVDLVGSYVQLRRQGRNFVGLCPWHDDRRPSLQVNPERQSFKCWVCDVGGDVFSFVMRMEGLEFREALEMLAERAGVALRQEPPSGGTPADGSQSDKRTLLRVMAWAEEKFCLCLAESPEAESARRYVAERGISPESVRRFHLGFAPDRWDWLLGLARSAQWTPAQLERVGLVIRRDTGDGFFDRFRGRLIFSIRDARSRPVAFGGRVLPQLADDRSAKYINSPETPLFSKHRELYGLDIARDAIMRAGAVVMEGYTDCLMAHQHGLDNAVAVLGTALGESHVQLLRRYTDSITLVLDGDEAGRRRTNEILDALLALFVRNQIDLRILTLPGGVDPCDFIAQQGCDALRQLLSQAVDALEHKFNVVTNGLAISTDTHRASHAVEQVLTTLARIRAPGGEASSATLLREQQMLGRIAREFHLPEEQLRSRLTALRREAHRHHGAAPPTPAAAEPAERVTLADLPAWDRELLELVLLAPDYLPRIEAAIEPSAIASTAARQIYDAYRRMAATGDALDPGRLMLQFDDPDMKSLVAQLDESSMAKSLDDRQRWLQGLIEAYQRRHDEDEQRKALATAQQDKTSAEALAAEFFQRSRAKHLSEYERRKR
jgi:DNA primase